MRRLFIIRKDLDLSRGKMGAMVGHCCEAYWINLLKNQSYYFVDLEFTDLPTKVDGQECYYKHPVIEKACKEAIKSGKETFTVESEYPQHLYDIWLKIDKDIWDNYANDIFTKTICEAKNLNDLLKIKDLIKQYNDKELSRASLDPNIETIKELIEDRDYGFINDKCLTELKPENEDCTTTVGVWFRPLPDDVAHFFSKKYKLFDAFHKKRNCDVYKSYDEARNAYIESHNVTDTNSDMMKWLFKEYKK